jgi:3-oxoacyl-[acyl-carrier protein] reductase
MRVIRGRKALVTGAGSGIGRAIALALARAGADLCLLGTDTAKLAAVAREAELLGVVVKTRICDLSQPSEITCAVNSLLAEWGRLNILVNNAGVAYYGPTHEMTAEQWQKLLAVNLLAPIQLVRELLPTLLAADEAHILNVCSIFGLTTLRKGAAYQTSKSGLVGFTAALRAEYGASDFGVTAVCPSFVRTAMLETFETGTAGHRHVVPAAICARPEDVAAAAVRAIRRNKGMVVMPLLARAMWRFTRLSPALVDWLTREGWRRRGRVRVAQH